MIRTLSHYFLLVVSITMLSCGDDDDKASRTDLLTAHAWGVTQYEVDGKVSDIIECSTDDVFTYSKDGKYASTTGALKCDDNEENLDGTWSLKDNDQVLSVTIDGVTNEGTIALLTSTTLKMKIKSTFVDDGVVRELDMYLISSAK